MMNQAPQEGTHAQGGGYGPPPGGYGPPGGAPPGGAPPGGYGPPGGAPPGGYGGPPPGGAPPGGYGPPGGAPPPAYGPPPGGAPMPPPGGGPMPGGPPMGMPGGDTEALKKQTQTWMIIGLISGFCLSGCIGWIGAVLAYLGSQSAQKGDLADAQSKLKIAKIVIIIGAALGLLGGVLYGIMIVMSQM